MILLKDIGVLRLSSSSTGVRTHRARGQILLAAVRRVKHENFARITFGLNRNVARKSVRLCPVARKIVMASTVYLETFGCQMNVADSERADVRLRAAGFDLSESPESADVVIFNTCSVRERAAHKVFTRIGEIRRQRLGNEPVGGVMGCVAQLEGKTLFDNSPSVNLIVGTRATDRLPELLNRALNGERRVIDLEERAEGERWDIPATTRTSK